MSTSESIAEAKLTETLITTNGIKELLIHIFVWQRVSRHNPGAQRKATLEALTTAVQIRSTRAHSPSDRIGARRTRGRLRCRRESSP